MLFLLSSVGLIAQDGTVSISESKDKITIGNGFITREFSTVGNKLKTTAINNLRTDGGTTVFVPAAKSSEFVIKPVGDKTAINLNLYAKTSWTITANSVTSQENAPARAIIDGNASTFWHSNYGQGTGPTSWPYFFVIDMKESKEINSVVYTARPTGINGIVKDYELYVSDSPDNFPTTPAAKGSINVNTAEKAYIALSATVTGRYVKFVLVNAKSDSGGQFGSCGEFDVSADVYVEPKTAISASDLTLKKTVVGTITDGKSVRFEFESYNFQNVDWTVAMVVEMKNGDHFMKKYLEISVPENQESLARFDYIDGELFEVNGTDVKWSHPPMGGGVGGMSGYWIALGQPIYIQGMFFGSEFPQTETSIDAANLGHIRYFSGKSLAELKAENRYDGKFTTWKTVAGSARSTEMNVVQADFFEYINTIARPTKLRTQYNSWYDWMMNITETNIQSSFYEMEKGFSQFGLPPMDSYVVDDGWNAYGPHKGDNTTGFWQFNSKFPNGLAPSSDFSHRVASNFGLWLGPRGGYNYNYEFAQFLEDNGNGMLNNASGDITTNHKKYLTKLQEFFLDAQDKYQINYWKLDGFSTKPPSRKSDQYITGGEEGMYYMTEHWERWGNILNSMYDKAESQGQNMWINLTCYVNPSPWLLQWGNSVWMQNSNDIGRHNTGLARQVDQLLTYRDDLYFDFYKERQFQFPASNMYNHDPIYGKTGTGLANQMTDDEFRAYLLMMATRGTAFWELYYSYNMMDEGQKWMINAEVVNWIDANFEILRNSKLIGSTPKNGNAYGFSCWDGDNGIISVRNPSTAAKTFTFTLDRNIGVKEGVAGLSRVTVLNFKSTSPDDNTKKYSYGETITLTLQPGEIRIWQFSPEADVTPAKIETVKSTANNAVLVKFDERVDISKATFKVNGTAAQTAVLMADFKSVKLTFSPALTDYAKATLAVENVVDYSANKANLTSEFVYYPENVILVAETPADFKPSQSISGVSDFNISFDLNTTQTGFNVFKQGSEVSVDIDAAGKVVFTVKGLTITSDISVADGTDQTISVCREKNGMLKIYIAGDVHKSLYDKSRINEAINAGTVSVGTTFSNLKVLNYALAFNDLKIVPPPVKPEFSTDKVEFWYRLRDNQGNQNKMYVVNDGSYTNRLKYRSTWSGGDDELFKFVEKTDGNKDEYYIYSKKDPSTRVSVNPAEANVIQVFSNTANDTWKIYPSKDPNAFCIQSVNTTGNNVMNSFNNSSTGGIIGFWNDDNAGDPGSQWVFELRLSTDVRNLSMEKLGVYAKDRRILSHDNDAKLVIYDVRGLMVNPDSQLVPGVYLVKVLGKAGTAKVLIQ